MTAVSWREAWRDSIEKRMDPQLGLPAVHAAYPARNGVRVKETTMPGGTASEPLWYAVDIGCVEPEHPYVRDFLAWTIEMGETMLGDTRRWQTQWAELEYAEQHSLLTGALALAYAMRDDAAPNTELLRTSRLDGIVAYDDANSAMWNNGVQSYYLRAIQFGLIGGDIAAAAQMLRCKRRFVWTEHWHDWLARFVASLEAGDGRLTNSADIDAFDELFDRVRNPKHKPGREKGQDMLISLPLLRLQLAVLRHKYVDGGPVAGCWRQILLSIAA
jgi:hypothetical protein